MGTRPIGLRDVTANRPGSRRKLLAPLRYLSIKSSEKTTYDLVLPAAIGAVIWVAYMVITPKPPLFGESGLLKFVRDLLIMAVPFLVGALATVAMGAPGTGSLDKRTVGVELLLDGQVLSLRQFVCYLLGYLCFIALVILISAVVATITRDTFVSWIRELPRAKFWLHAIGSGVLFIALSCLTITVFWALYFLTDIVNRRE